MDVFSLLASLREPEPLTPEKRARDFQSLLQSARPGDEIEIRGFLLMREPPNSPRDALYYLLSPLSPSELEKSRFRTFAVLKITERTKVSKDADFRGGAYVRVRGLLEPYPYGTLRAVNVLSIEGEDYSSYWRDYRGYALSRQEMEELFASTFHMNFQLRTAFIYTLFSSPTLPEYRMSEGGTLSIIETNERIVRSFWEVGRYLMQLLPPELLLRKGRARRLYVDSELDMDFPLFLPGGSMRYYSPSSPALLRREVPVAKWAMEYFTSHGAVFITPKATGKLTPTDSLAHLSEFPFIRQEPAGVERNREFEQLVPNILVTIALARERVKTLSTGDSAVKDFWERFQRWLTKNRFEYGEMMDALMLHGSVFNADTRFRLSLSLLGEMARFEGKVTNSLKRDVLEINQELLDTWINEVPEETIMRAVKNYEAFVSRDRRMRMALRLFLDLEATSPGGLVGRAEFEKALVGAGFRPADASRITDMLIKEGYIFQPRPGRLRLIVRDF